MSRRKQAKPRAVLKHDADEELQEEMSLSNAKEESVSDPESETDEQMLNSEGVLMINSRRKETCYVNDDAFNDKLQLESIEQDALCQDRETDTYSIEDYNNEDDENTSDSFYSDLYSTHTSSSYSPSMSEEAATPNSLHHQHHLHHHHHHHGENDDEDDECNRLRDNVSGKDSNLNGSANEKSTKQEGNGGTNGDIDNEEHEDDEVGSNDEGRGSKRHGDKHASTNHKEVRFRDGSGDIRIPSKIRKIDRESGKEKMTGDGIKTTSDGSYQCQFCDKSFPRLGYLKKHEQSHAEHLPFKCEYCARLFKHKRSRDRHTKLHTGDRRYRCPHCEAAFSRSDHLKIHMKTHDNQKPFQCTVCNRGYNTAAALTSHMQNHKKQAALLGGIQPLSYSPRSTGSASSNGSFHRRRYGAVDCSPSRIEFRKQLRGSIISCIYCTKADFTSVDQLNAHIKSMHENAASRDLNHTNTNHTLFQLSCEYCTMKFPNIPAMFQHMRTTHVDRLASPNSYFEHFNRLAASGTFSPRLVGNTRFEEVKVKVEEPSPKPERQIEPKEEEQVSPTDLSQPKNQPSPQNTERESPKKPGMFLCNQCNAGLPDFETFRSHLKTHIAQGVTNLVCHHCGLSLRDQAEYERHVISHFLITNSEFTCAHSCNKTFTKVEDLQKHLFETHIQSIFKCTLCADVFDTKVAIQVHFACAHSNENKIFRCSACMETFRSDKDFSMHVRTRHNNAGAIQCMFCRAVCSSELEMHFHLAAHARQFRCPSCPETFHVEFLLDRHMQTHHSQKDGSGSIGIQSNSSSGSSYPSGFNKQQQITNNNNNILDYHAFAGGKSLFQLPGNKFYNPLQVDTSASKQSAALMYGLGQRYFEANKTLMDMYNYHHQDSKNANYFLPPNTFENRRSSKAPPQEQKQSDRTTTNGFSCGICERSDFRTEAEVHSHRKVVHNLKTGVSLRCAYCSGNFKSRSELEHHMKTCHNSTGKHKCLICDEIFPSPAILAEHKLQHSKVGQSGKCTHCSAPLSDVAAFKAHLGEHNAEGQIPVQCICCRQTLNSDFEIGLHAKFHTKSSVSPENVCALCLEPLPGNTETRVCEKCCRKHNLTSKFNMRFGATRTYVENRCNLCKVILPHAQKLQEHLVEHTFVGCEERGYSCYICSAVFTVPAGLLAHMNEHGQNARPYDCNICPEKYFFRAELENHLIEHELNGGTSNSTEKNNDPPSADSDRKVEQQSTTQSQPQLQVKTENTDPDDEEEEYIEVEKVPEVTNANLDQSDCTSN